MSRFPNIFFLLPLPLPPFLSIQRRSRSLTPIMEKKSPRISEFLDEQQQEKIQEHVQTIIDGLPDDLRLSILKRVEANAAGKEGEKGA